MKSKSVNVVKTTVGVLAHSCNVGKKSRSRVMSEYTRVSMKGDSK